MEYLRDSNPRIQKNALRVLNYLDTEESLKRIVETALNNPNEIVSKSACQVVSEVESADRARLVVEYIIELLRNDRIQSEHRIPDLLTSVRSNSDLNLGLKESHNLAKILKRSLNDKKGLAIYFRSFIPTILGTITGGVLIRLLVLIGRPSVVENDN